MLRRRFIASGFLWLAGGVIWLLVLDHKLFDRTIVALGCYVLSALLWLKPARLSGQSGRLAAVALIVHSVVIVGLAGSLPSAYRYQKAWDARIEQLQESVGRAGVHHELD